MLSPNDNHMLTQVGSGTPMGDMMRRFWLPGLLPWELPAPDCPPIRFRLLGEELVAYRDTSGRVGVLAQACPHRGASMFFGRNEEDGLRCVYHGWKFDMDGNCTDMPNEPAESNFKHKIHATAYPAREHGGIIWVYMGLAEHLPELPGFLSNQLPAEHTVAWKRHQSSNYMQALEGGIDPSHAAFLHSYLDPGNIRGVPNQIMNRDRHPRSHIVDTDYGVLIGSSRHHTEAEDFLRTNIFLMPCYTMAPVDSGANPILRWSGWVPMDDHNVMRFTTECDPVMPIRESPKYKQRYTDVNSNGFLGGDEYEPASALPGSPFRTRATRDNDYFVDRELQRTRRYSGMTDAGTEDQAMTESMGTVYTRDREHLGTTDIGVIAARRCLLKACKALQSAGVPPTGALTPGAYQVNATNVFAPAGVHWVEAVREGSSPQPGVYPKML